MPRFSSSLIRPASEYLAGGWVSFSSASMLSSFNGLPALSFGKITSSLAERGSALSQPSKMIREPLSQKSGIGTPEPCAEAAMLATTFVRITSADFI